MNRETYEEIKKQILESCECHSRIDLEHLDAIKDYIGVFNPQTSLKHVKNGLESPRKPEMKVLKEMPAHGVSMQMGTNVMEIPILRKYVGKLHPCEIKGCLTKTQPDRKCPSCSKIICTKHLRGKVCKECNDHGAE